MEFHRNQSDGVDRQRDEGGIHEKEYGQETHFVCSHKENAGDDNWCDSRKEPLTLEENVRCLLQMQHVDEPVRPSEPFNNYAPPYPVPVNMRAGGASTAQGASRTFDQIDTNGDGVISREVRERDGTQLSRRLMQNA